MDATSFNRLRRLNNITDLQETIDRISIPRVVGSDGHQTVREFIINYLRRLKWDVEVHSFHDKVPLFEELEFHNIIARLNPNAERYLILSCHYDSKHFPDIEFIGATDAAVSCAIILNLARVLNEELEKFRHTDVSLMFVFFDGEEAFKEWSSIDSIYGSRRLAQKWKQENFLDGIDILVLLDLIGAPDPQFYSYFPNTQNWYTRFIILEERLSEAGQIRYGESSVFTDLHMNRYFQPNALRSNLIEDDHTPFLKLGVPILHIIPSPFPEVWHTADDNLDVIDYNATENIAYIIRLFTMEYLLGGQNHV